MGTANTPFIIQGAYSDHFQNLQKKGIEILKQDNFYERGDVIHKIRKLQQETQKRRKDQQSRREQEEKKEEERRKQILEERRRHLQEVTEKYQRLGRKRFRLLTATASPLVGRAVSALDEAHSLGWRGDGASSAMPSSGFQYSGGANRGTSADVISRMQEHGLSITSPNNNGQTSEASMPNEYKKAPNNQTMLSALNPPNAHNAAQLTNANANNAVTNGSYSAQFQAVRANHQRLLEQLGLKSTPTPEVTKAADTISSTGNRIHIDATNSKPPSGQNSGLSSQTSSAITSRPSSGVTQGLAPTAVISDMYANKASVIVNNGANGLPTVVATAATVQEAMQNSYSLSSRTTSTTLKPLSTTPVQQQTLQQSVLFLQSNGVISTNASNAPATALQNKATHNLSHQPSTPPPPPAPSHQSQGSHGANNHQFGTIIHMHQQSAPLAQMATVGSKFSLPPPPEPSVPVSSPEPHQPLKLTSVETVAIRPQPQTVVQLVQPSVSVVSQPPAPKERPIGLVRPSSASSVKREGDQDVSVALDDSLNVTSSESKPITTEKQNLNSQFGSIKVVTLQEPKDETNPVKQQQQYLTAVPSVPEVVRVFNATAPDGATLMAQINEMKTVVANQSNQKAAASSAISLNFQIPSGVTPKLLDEELDAIQKQSQPIAVNSKPTSVLTNQQPVSNIPTAAQRPPIGKAHNSNNALIPPETAYTDFSRPVNKFYDPAAGGVSMIKRYNSDSALADQAQSNQHNHNQLLNHQMRGETAPEQNDLLGQAAPSKSAPRSILKRSPSAERSMASNQSGLSSTVSHSGSSVGFNTLQLQRENSQSGKSVSFGHVHIADLTADGPIAVRDSIELTKVHKHDNQQQDKQKRKVLFTMDEDTPINVVSTQQTQQPQAFNAPQTTGGLAKSSSGSQIIRVEMGQRATPRGQQQQQVPASPNLSLQRSAGTSAATLYSNSLQQRAMTSVGSRPPVQNSGAQQYHSNMDTTSNNGLPVDHAPSDAEINWLWEKVRSCLNRSQSATASRVPASTLATGQPLSMPNSFGASIPRTGSAPLSSATSRFQQQQGHKLYIDGSSINNGTATGVAQLYTGVTSGTTNFSNARTIQQQQQQQQQQGPLKHLVATGVNVTPRGRGDELISQSTMAFLAAEQLVAGGLSESVIHDTIDHIQNNKSQPQQHGGLQPIPQQYQTPAGNGRSALSMEEEQIMKSLDRINDRLQYLEVTGQPSTSAKGASPYANMVGPDAVQPSFMPAHFPPQNNGSRQSNFGSATSRRFLNSNNPPLANQRF